MTTSVAKPRSMNLSPAKREAISFYLFILPWFVGFVAFTLGPIAASLGLSLTQYDMMLAPKWVGIGNYRELLGDSLFYTSLWNTVFIVLLAVPLGMVTSFCVALLLNQNVRGMPAYRTAYYIPSIVPAVASAALWMYLLQPQWGVVNGILETVGIPGPGWLASKQWAKPAIILVMVWGSGGTMIIYLAGLQDIPEALYEAAEIDGAGRLGKLWNVTIPLMTPTIFFTLIMGVINTFQVFSIIFVLTDGMGGPVNATLVYLIYIYRKAFVSFKMGYTCAMAWVLFIVILILTLAQFKTASYWVYYEGERKPAG